ncbi:MAG: sigma-70 family RNA polymerase sigma factor [Cyclobacteriaceae bacterium]|nr:sigma-70 family RNA polymerase sigma factor [Cyclobacteriaceae bacterium]MDH4297907.1 sigma-70 family RNA polymerase sigma factor [Cyclobacteriaceae bacterium]MDH5248806.1 sigma-70 family RNA polymerase sigma factor [Cyclobacteriaceae bacterium]
MSQKIALQEHCGDGMGISLRYSEKRHQCLEILNDAFVKILVNLKKFDLSKTWLSKIIVNTIDPFHKKQREIQVKEMRYAKHDPATEKLLSGISFQEVMELLQKLPRSYRAVFNLYVIEGYTHDEIANLLNIDKGTSQANLFRAKEQLKLILVDYFETDYAGTQ